MPDAKLPTTLKGWVVAAAASGVGFISGFYALRIFSRWAK